jgi:putative pyruvate formate lyase activating enzyme
MRMKRPNRRRFIKSGYIFSLSGLFAQSWSILGSFGFNKKSANEISESVVPEKNIPILRNSNISSIDFEPAYLKLYRSGELKRRGQELWEIMGDCKLCPRACGANKLAGERGFCKATSRLEVSSYHPHHGEEKPLRGKNGSGTIFLTHCSLRCVFCINWEVSQGGQGFRRSIDSLAKMMLHLQKIGCHNINFVTPTHYSPHILLAVDKAASKGLRLPLVYNTCGWERTEILKKLDGVIDIYLPDFKYADGEMAGKYSSEAYSYPEVTKQALLEMHRQVGVAKPASNGLMSRGLMIRHLVMPNNVSGSQDVMKWIADSLPKNTFVNIMSQYRPMYKAKEFPEINRRLYRGEYDEVVSYAKNIGLTNLEIQGY